MLQAAREFHGVAWDAFARFCADWHERYKRGEFVLPRGMAGRATEDTRRTVARLALCEAERYLREKGRWPPDAVLDPARIRFGERERLASPLFSPSPARRMIGDAKLRWLKERNPHVVHIVLDHEEFDLAAAPTAGIVWKSMRRANQRLRWVAGIVERYAAFGGFVNPDIAPRHFGRRSVLLLHAHMILEHYRVPGALVYKGTRTKKTPRTALRTNPVLAAAWRASAREGEKSGVVTTSVAHNAEDIEREMFYTCGARIVEGVPTSKVLGLFADDVAERENPARERTQWSKPTPEQFVLMCAFFARGGATHRWLGAWDHTSTFGKFVKRHPRALKTLLPGALGVEGLPDDPRELRPVIRRWLFEVTRRRTDPNVTVPYADL